MFHTFYCNFGWAEENRSLHRGLCLFRSSLNRGSIVEGLQGWLVYIKMSLKNSATRPTWKGWANFFKMIIDDRQNPSMRSRWCSAFKRSADWASPNVVNPCHFSVRKKLKEKQTNAIFHIYSTLFKDFTKVKQALNFIVFCSCRLICWPTSLIHPAS